MSEKEGEYKASVKDLHISKNDALDKLATPSEFREELQRCQARIERTNSFFSIIIFDIRGAQSKTLDEDVAHTLLNRTRASDYVGWFDKNHIGVILDGCLVCSALNFGNSVCQHIAEWRTPPRRATIQTFPVEIKDEQDVKYDECRSCDGGEHAYDVSQTSLTCPSLCIRKSAFMPTSITVEYGAMVGTEMRTPTGAGLPLWKRMMDVFVSLTVLLILSPILLLVAIIVGLTSSGGIIYRQERIGYLGRPFVLYKFRSMTVAKVHVEHQEYMKHLISEEGGDDKPMLKEQGNTGARITKIGKIIRCTSLDEIPQLLNVIKGEMSLIGPRPPIPYEVEVYKRWHGGRFDSVPGLTGLWQVSGKNSLSFKEMARLDIKYSRNLSFWNDLVILFKTPMVIVREFVDGIRGSERKADSTA